MNKSSYKRAWEARRRTNVTRRQPQRKGRWGGCNKEVSLPATSSVPAKPPPAPTGCALVARYKPDSVLAEAQPAISFWGSFHKYFNHLLTDSQRTEFSLPSQVIRRVHREATYTGSGPSSRFQMGKQTQREKRTRSESSTPVAALSRALRLWFGNDIYVSLQNMPRRGKCIRN